MTAILTFLRASWLQLALAGLVSYVAWDYKTAKDSVVSLTTTVQELTQTAALLKEQAQLVKDMSALSHKVVTDVVAQAAASEATLQANVTAIKEVAKHAKVTTCPLPDSLSLAVGQLRQPGPLAGGGQR